ncbi:MAG: hypothetical protein DHS20C02_04640 [Micavibrio sp.]|nr:MAG: hypothetical protein DHS20C02_04640 [Micavibrio sp.]
MTGLMNKCILSAVIFSAAVSSCAPLAPTTDQPDLTCGEVEQKLAIDVSRLRESFETVKEIRLNSKVRTKLRLMAGEIFGIAGSAKQYKEAQGCEFTTLTDTSIQNLWEEIEKEIDLRFVVHPQTEI